LTGCQERSCSGHEKVYCRGVAGFYRYWRHSLVEPVPSLEMGRVVSGRASGIKFLPPHSDFEYQWIILDDVGQSGMVFWLVRAVTYKTSICRRYLSLASWGEPRWNPCHSLIFDYFSTSIEEKTANPGYPGKPWV
jgi:hypothetical protein